MRVNRADSWPWDCNSEVGVCSLSKKLPLGQKGARKTAHTLSLQIAEHRKGINDTDKM